MRPFRRKMLVIVGSSGVGRRTLKTRLLQVSLTAESELFLLPPIYAEESQKGKGIKGTCFFVMRAGHI